MLSGLDGRRDVRGTKPGGGRQENDIDPGANHLLVGVKSGENSVGRDIHARGDLAVAFQLRHASLGPVAKHVAHGHELNLAVGAQGLAGRASSTCRPCQYYQGKVRRWAPPGLAFVDERRSRRR